MNVKAAKKPPAGVRPHAVLVLGMHRAGTSATARVVNLLGATLGDDLLPPAADNPGGFWERKDVTQLHDRLLAAMGRRWNDVRALPPNWMESPIARGAGAEIGALIDEQFAGLPLWVVKDPRLCWLAPLWLGELDRRGIVAHALLVVRHPHEVAGSLQARDRMRPENARLLWLQYLLAAERASRDRPRSLLCYDQLLDDWRGSMQRVSAEMQLAWPRPLEASAEEIDAYLDQGQRHHDAVADPLPLPALMQETYAAARLAALGDTAGWQRLAAAGAAYDLAAGSFVPSLDALTVHATALEGRALHAERLLNGHVTDPDMLRRQESHILAVQSGIGAIGRAVGEDLPARLAPLQPALTALAETLAQATDRADQRDEALGESAQRQENHILAVQQGVGAIGRAVGEDLPARLAPLQPALTALGEALAQAADRADQRDETWREAAQRQESHILAVQGGVGAIGRAVGEDLPARLAILPSLPGLLAQVQEALAGQEQRLATVHAEVGRIVQEQAQQQAGMEAMQRELQQWHALQDAMKNMVQMLNAQDADRQRLREEVLQAHAVREGVADLQQTLHSQNADRARLHQGLDQLGAALQQVDARHVAAGDALAAALADIGVRLQHMQAVQDEWVGRGIMARLRRVFRRQG